MYRSQGGKNKKKKKNNNDSNNKMISTKGILACMGQGVGPTQQVRRVAAKTVLSHFQHTAYFLRVGRPGMARVMND